jgi:hypothetical protein
LKKTIDPEIPMSHPESRAKLRVLRGKRVAARLPIRKEYL